MQPQVAIYYKIRFFLKVFYEYSIFMKDYNILICKILHIFKKLKTFIDIYKSTTSVHKLP